MSKTILAPRATPGRPYGSFAGKAGAVFPDPVDGVLTALHEQVGNSVVASFSAEYLLRLPYGHGGARVYLLTPTVGGLSVVLPDARLCSVGGIPTATIYNAGASSFDVLDKSGSVVATIAAGAGASFRLRSNASMAGFWIVRTLSPAVGATLADRVPVDVRLTESNLTPFNLRSRIIEMGFTAQVAYGVRCTIAAGVVIGSNSSLVPAFDTGTWPVGSTLLLVLESGSWIAGRGGDGGRGGDVPPGLLAQVGKDGGTGFRMYLPTALVSAGTIQGGGGGGGAHAYASTTPGAGGGGGAGYGGGDGGRSGNNTLGQSFPGGEGVAGSISYPGGGGFTPAGVGAYGGLPGAGGAASDSAGGNAGNAIEKPMAHVLTKIRAGTINGAEV